MKVLSNRFTKSFVRNLLMACVVPAASMIASAQTSGYDFFQTTTGAAADVSNITGVSPSLVPLKGVPIMASAGNTDTIIHRTADGNSPINVFALFMKNSGVVTYMGQSVDLYITINNSAGFISTSVLPQPDALTPSIGTITIHPTTFDSDITVVADVIIVAPGASPTGPSKFHGPANPTPLTTQGSSWSSVAPPGYPSVTGLPSGGFYPSPVHINGGRHPVSPASCPSVGGASATKPGPKGNTPIVAVCAVAN